MRTAGLLVLAALLVAPLGVAAHERQPAGRQSEASIDERAAAIATEVSGQDIYDTILSLTTDPSRAYRFVGTPTHDNARAWIESELSGIGLAPVAFDHACEVGSVVVFPAPAVRLPQPMTVPARSVLALVEGRSATDWIVIGAHYDTQQTSTGALDNGSGIAAALELARAFARHREALEASILFAFWDCEEWGVFGSKEFMARFPDVEALLGLPQGTVRLVAATSLDMIGIHWPAENRSPTARAGVPPMYVRTSPIDQFTYRSRFADYNESNYTAAQLQGFRDFRVLVKRATYDVLGFPVQHVWVQDDEQGRSDHAPFIAAGVPGFKVGGAVDLAYPPYHNPFDTLPAAEQLAGGKDKLVAAFEAAARLTATIMANVALQGAVQAPDEGVVPSHAQPEAGRETPLPAAVAALAVSLGACARRARR
ncbi:MAG TPA: M20/M25/M40 family metallo-hydrolase [Candidatus Thermoplasmatota archaeon]|nr:M20/M25/M40 family metallo-hydrolase [Candidatus Thermoplasmatota archaeon]